MRVRVYIFLLLHYPTSYDPTDSGSLFKNITVYDSLKRSSRKTTSTIQTRFGNKSPATVFLKKFQEVLQKFVLYGTDYYNILEYDKDYITSDVKYCMCPQQRNLTDCSLFSVGVLLHVFYIKKNYSIFLHTRQYINVT